MNIVEKLATSEPMADLDILELVVGEPIVIVDCDRFAYNDKIRAATAELVRIVSECSDVDMLEAIDEKYLGKSYLFLFIDDLLG